MYLPASKLSQKGNIPTLPKHSDQVLGEDFEVYITDIYNFEHGPCTPFTKVGWSRPSLQAASGCLNIPLLKGPQFTQNCVSMAQTTTEQIPCS